MEGYRTYRKQNTTTIFGRVYIQTARVVYGQKIEWEDVLGPNGKRLTFANDRLADLYIAQLIAEDTESECPPSPDDGI